MAKPVNPIEIWAYEDYDLPNAHTKNKVRPIDDLWRKGYDKGQKPTVQSWNYIWNLSTDWIRYLTEEQIPALDEKYLKKDLNFSDLPNKVTARENLGVFSKDESDARFVNVDGDEMSGPLKLPRINFNTDSTDTAFIEATSPYADKTFFDVSFGDNFGDKYATNNVVDVFRIRFRDSGTQVTRSLVEVHADTSNSAYMEVSGTVWARSLISNGDILAPNGVVSSSRLKTTGLADLAALTSRGNIAVSHSGKTAYYQENGDVVGTIWGTGGANGGLKAYIDSKSQTSASLGQERGWFKDEKTGFITQWAVGQWKGYANESFDTVTFPIAFPNECISVNCGTQLQGESSRADGFAQVAAWNRTSARVCVQWAGDSGQWDTAMRVIIWAHGR